MIKKLESLQYYVHDVLVNKLGLFKLDEFIKDDCLQLVFAKNDTPQCDRPIPGCPDDGRVVVAILKLRVGYCVRLIDEVNGGYFDINGSLYSAKFNMINEAIDHIYLKLKT